MTDADIAKLRDFARRIGVLLNDAQLTLGSFLPTDLLPGERRNGHAVAQIGRALDELLQLRRILERNL